MTVLVHKPAAPDPAPLGEGARLAPGYEVIEHLSRSKLLDVYDVWSEERDCRCVAKMLRPDCAEDTRGRRRLIDEGRLLQRLTHPHIVRAYETLERPQPIVILETIGGATLWHLICTRSRRLTLADIAFLGLHLCLAVGYLHRNGILHRDVKPANVITDHGQAKLIDLSLAKPPGRSSPGAGTPSYMAPEQVRGGELGPAADVWGIGAVLFTAAVGHAPFDADPITGRYPQVEEQAEPVSRHRRVPTAFTETIAACLEPDAESRLTVWQLVERLDALLGP
jgi:serine/threonine protein kinase